MKKKCIKFNVKQKKIAARANLTKQTIETTILNSLRKFATMLQITLWEVASTKRSPSDSKEAMALRSRHPSAFERTL